MAEQFDAIFKRRNSNRKQASLMMETQLKKLPTKNEDQFDLLGGISDESSEDTHHKYYNTLEDTEHSYQIIRRFRINYYIQNLLKQTSVCF
jgi:DNA polymerase-1